MNNLSFNPDLVSNSDPNLVSNSDHNRQSQMAQPSKQPPKWSSAHKHEISKQKVPFKLTQKEIQNHIEFVMDRIKKIEIAHGHSTRSTALMAGFWNVIRINGLIADFKRETGEELHDKVLKAIHDRCDK